jgi:DUF1009 family protein
MAETVGLIAGQGQLPILEARGMRAAGYRVACVGLAGQYDPALPRHCDFFAEAGIARLGRWIRLLRGWGVERAVMVGAVRKGRMHEPLRLLHQVPDWRAARLWYRVLRQDKRDQSLLAAVAGELAEHGVELTDTTQYIRDHLAQPGLMTRRQPTANQWGDLQFAWPLLMQLAKMDVGQALAVKERDVIAVEAVEGTDAMIDRVSGLCRSGGWVLAKGVGPGKDLRFDVPTVGPGTIERLERAGCKCLALAADRVILLQRGQVIDAAERAGIAVVGVTENGPPEPPPSQRAALLGQR